MTTANAESMLETSGSTTFSIPSIVRMATSGVLRIPHFQRSFVWERSDVRKLFDSIYKGYPVGTILLWKRPAAAETVEFGPIRIHADAKGEAYWVVDGQQRITALVGSLGPDFKGVDERFEHEFNLTSRRFESSQRASPAPRGIPVRQARDSRSMSFWLRSYADELEPDEFDLGDKLVGAIRDYKLPAYIVEGDNENVLRDIFDRVNSAGKPISRAQVFHALFASTGSPGSPGSVVSALQRLNFGVLEENRVVQALLAIRGGDVQRDLHEEFDPDDDPAKWYDKTEEALGRAIYFIRQQGVPHLLLMPSTLPLPVLAAYFYLHPEPSEWSRRTLERWLWRGWVYGFGREGQTPAMRRAVRQVNPRRLIVEAAPSEEDAARSLLESIPIGETPNLRLREFVTKNAAGRLILLAEASQRPTYADGRPIQLDLRLNDLGVEAVTEFVPRRRRYAAARGFWPQDLYPFTGLESELVLGSHLISPAAAAAFRAGDHAGFVLRREDSVESVTRHFLARRLDTSFAAFPEVETLLVPDPY